MSGEPAVEELGRAAPALCVRERLDLSLSRCPGLAVVAVDDVAVYRTWAPRVARFSVAPPR